MQGMLGEAGEGHFYLWPEGKEEIDLELDVWKASATFYLLFNMLVPLDLAVAITIAKACYTYFMQKDAHMVDV